MNDIDIIFNETHKDFVSEIRRIDGCLKNSYHVTALHNAGDCDGCLNLLSRGYMKFFGIKSHVQFGSVS